MVANIEAGRYQEPVDKAKAMDTEELKKTYQEREMEPAMAGEDWTPKENYGL
jgi:hypothetical protein